MAAGTVRAPEVAPMTDDAKVDTLEARLRSKLEITTGFADEATMVHELNRIFRFFNTDKDGWVSFEEFNAALVRLNFVGVQREVRALFDRYDTDGSGFLAYEEFVAGLFRLIPNPRGDAGVRSAIDRMRARIAERGGMNGIRSLARVLRILDDSGNKKIDRDELKYGMRDFGLDLSERDLDTIMDCFDRNKDGQIDFDELLRGLRGSLNRRRRELIMMAFDVLDKDGSGEVTIEDIRVAYSAKLHPEVRTGRKTEDDVLREFLSQWDTLEKDGIVQRDEFLDYYKDISASIDDDDYFELMIRNAWRISGGTGASANTANRRVLVIHSDGTEEIVEIKKELGLDIKNFLAVKRALEAQGVTDIADIKVHG